jgi:formylglycine-generating enzyme required for sulfatase activity
MPVYCVSFKDAANFANKYSMEQGLDPCYVIDDMTDNVRWPKGTRCTGWRLPTEAEWEAGALYTRNGHYGNSSIYAGGKFPDEIAWHKGNSNGRPHEVAQLQPTDIGLYDMSGNVAEWIWDYHADYPTAAQTDYTGPLSGEYKIIRGGSWEGNTRYVRVMYRGKTLPSSKSDNLGFRVVRSIIR